MADTTARTLDERLAEFRRGRFLAMPIAGTMVWMNEPTSLPLSVGILAGLMWVPFSWLINHWIGLFHGIARTVLVVVAWFLFPRLRFVVIPAVIVAIYLVTIYFLLRRSRT